MTLRRSTPMLSLHRCQVGRYDRQAFIAAAAPERVGLLLLGTPRRGVPEVRRAQTWPAGTSRGTLLARLGAAYRSATNLGPTRVVLASLGATDPLAPLLRRAVGPLAHIESRRIPALDWKALIRLGVNVLDPECAEDNEYLAVLAERACARGGPFHPETTTTPTNGRDRSEITRPKENLTTSSRHEN